MRLCNQPSINVTVPSVVLWDVVLLFFLLSQKNEGWSAEQDISCLC